MPDERVVYLNGKIIPESTATISIHDLGFTLGDGVYDMTRTFEGRIFRLEEHIERLYRSLKYMRIDPGLSQVEMADLSRQVLEANLGLLGKNEDYWVGQRVTRGRQLLHEFGAAKPVPTVLILCQPLPFAARAKYYREGLPVVVPSIRRTPPECMSPRAKVQNYINLVQGDIEARAQNPDGWAILLDMNGNIAEGVGSNFFIVQQGKVLTPREQFILPGISRRTAIELCRELDIEVREVDIDLYDAYTADEAFITSTSFCICPVSSVNGVTLGDGSIPGPVTTRLLGAYGELVGLDIVEQYLSHL